MYACAKAAAGRSELDHLDALAALDEQIAQALGLVALEQRPAHRAPVVARRQDLDARAARRALERTERGLQVAAEQALLGR
ncbi:hypothetical protein, partial [Rubrivivax gelatinosus]|uniref:hypothetical protein n=1 Tax=Rubrivivax gelatinosus TaxID=28068 RepID=UPI001ED97794